MSACARACAGITPCERDFVRARGCVSVSTFVHVTTRVRRGVGRLGSVVKEENRV